ncbi:MAG: hypothetical protein ACR2JY_15740 [Chloroflexota bacterium]
MAETRVVVLDDFADNGAKWTFVGDNGAGYAATWTATTQRAGTAQGNIGGLRTLGYTFTGQAQQTSIYGVSVALQCSLPAAVNISASETVCCDLFMEPGLAANVNRLSVQVQTAGGNATITPAVRIDATWNYVRQALASLSGIDPTRVTGVLVELFVNPGVSGRVEIDTLRAGTYVYAGSDYYQQGRHPGDPTAADIVAALPAVRRYLFGQGAGIGVPAGGYQTDATQPNFGAVAGVNAITGAATNVGLDTESDHTYCSGLLLVGLCQLYRMTSDPSYLTQATWIVDNYFLAWYVSSATPGAAAGSLGFMPFWVTSAGVRANYVSTDQIQGALLGLLEYFILTGRNNPALAQLFRDWQTWWNSAGHVAFDGTPNANQVPGQPAGLKSPLVDLAVAFATVGDGGAAGGDTTYTTPSYPAANYAYQTGWVGSGNAAFAYYQGLVFAEDLLRCRLRRAKNAGGAPYPTAQALATLGQNALFAFGFGGGNQYYATDMAGDFNKRPLGWTAVEGTPWNGAAKQLLVSTTGPNDYHDLAGVQWGAYLGPLLLENGGDAGGLIAAGQVTSVTQVQLLQAILGLAVKNALILPGTIADGALPREVAGPWGIYHNGVVSGRAGRGVLVDEQPNHQFVAAYAYWYLLTQFGGLWPAGAYDRVVDWQYQPGTLTLRLTANGQAGDTVTIPINGMQAGHRYALTNETTGTQHGPIAGGAYALTWTLAQPEETWLIYDVAQPPTRVLRSGAGTPRTVFVS